MSELKRQKWIDAMQRVCIAAELVESGLRVKDVSKRMQHDRMIDLRVALDQKKFAEQEYFGEAKK